MSDPGSGRARGRGGRGRGKKNKKQQQQQPNIPGLHVEPRGGQQRYIPGLPQQQQQQQPQGGQQRYIPGLPQEQQQPQGGQQRYIPGLPQQQQQQQERQEPAPAGAQGTQAEAPRSQGRGRGVPPQAGPSQPQAPQAAAYQAEYQQEGARQAAYQQQYSGAEYQQEDPQHVAYQQDQAQQEAYRQQYTAAQQAQEQQQTYQQTAAQQQAYHHQQQPQQQQHGQQQAYQQHRSGPGAAQTVSYGREGGASYGRGRPPKGDSDKPPTAKMGAMRLGRSEESPYQKYVEPVWNISQRSTVGTSGTPLNLLSNYFKLNFGSEFVVYQYAVAFKPEIENVRMKFAMIKSVPAILGDVTLFDGGILYLRQRLEKEPTVVYSKRETDDTNVEITFSLKDQVTQNMPQILQIVNCLFKKMQVALDMKKIKDHYYIPERTVQIKKHKLEVMPGYTTSILHYEAGTLLGCDLTHKVLRLDSVLDLMYEMYHSMNTDDLKAFRAKVLHTVVGMIVMTRFNSKTYRVDDIDWEARPTSTFERKGEPISFIDYYKQTWNETINDMDQPLLISRPTDRDRRGGRTDNVKLLPEMCFVTGLSEQARADFNLMKDLAVHTRIGPEQRVTRLQEFLNQIDGSDKVKQLLAPWDLSFTTTPVQVPARQLPPEQLLMRSSNKQYTKITYLPNEAEWGRNMRNMHLLTPVHLENWLLIFPDRCKGSVNDFTDCLIRVSKSMGLRIHQPTIVEMHNDRNESYLLAIRQNLNDQVQMVVAVVPNPKKDRYDAIKKCCCIDNPVPSQVVLQKTLNRKQGLMSIASKIAIQMNCKMGGEVWGVEIPLKGLMVIGMDSYHDSANKGQSVGAFVASLNKDCTRYYSRTENHVTKEELMNNLTILAIGAFKKYYEVNDALPQKIVVYRDGVGDGQLKTVFEHEWNQFQQAFRKAGGKDYNPGAAFIVVKKRILTRLFSRDRTGMTNPLAGTVADKAITKPEWYDFFLVSQSVKQGTVSPTAYNVITDNTGLQPDHVQRLTFKMTHLYFNWQGTVRVPAPCQYAHKLAFLQGQSLHREPSALLTDKLFYL